MMEEQTHNLFCLLDVEFFHQWAAPHQWKGVIYRQGTVYKPHNPQVAMWEYFKTPLNVWYGTTDSAIYNYRLAAKHFVAQQIKKQYDQYWSEKLGVAVTCKM